MSKKKSFWKIKKIYSFAQLVILFSLPSTTMPSPCCVQLLKLTTVGVIIIVLFLVGEWGLCGVHGFTGWPLTWILILGGIKPYGKHFPTVDFLFFLSRVDQANKMNHVIEWFVNLWILSWYGSGYVFGDPLGDSKKLHLNSRSYTVNLLILCPLKKMFI